MHMNSLKKSKKLALEGFWRGRGGKEEGRRRRAEGRREEDVVAGGGKYWFDDEAELFNLSKRSDFSFALKEILWNL